MLEPHEIVIEQDCRDFPLAKHLEQLCAQMPSCHFSELNPEEVRNYLTYDTSKPLSRFKSTWCVTQRHGFHIQKVGAGTSNPACDYDIHFITGCPHQCMYCQQLYTIREIPYIAIYPDLNILCAQVQEIVETSPKNPVLFEIGNMTDMLALESYTQELQDLIPFWAQVLNGRAQLQFLTKSCRVQALLDLDHQGVIRPGFTLNLPEFTGLYEPGTASFSQRLQAIRTVLKHGYRLHLSFSPMIYREGIFAQYDDLFHRISDFLRESEGFNEADLTLEVLILFQKSGGETLMRQYYPKDADNLLQHLVPSDGWYRYPQEMYTKLLSFFASCMHTHFPMASVLFIS